ncbi:AraC family transcriptional regulator [Marinobacterium iners]|uniref:AraC family transcriptional regulator n=1 Tax=Marinobacterium iners TaxID=48076 RepID=UPI001A8C2042|nr:AraC family transcriptional regulator [Marinobacterium iners]
MKNNFETDNFHDALSKMTYICGPHILTARTTQDIKFKNNLQTLKATSTTIGHIEYGTDVTIEIDDLADSFSISLPTVGMQHLESPENNATSDQTTGIIISPTQPLKLHIDGNCNKILVRISRQAMEETLAQLLHQKNLEPLVFNHLISASNGPTGDWWRMVQYLCTELSNPNQMLYNSPAFSYHIEKTLIKGILLSQNSNYSDRLSIATDAGLPSYLIRAKQFIEKNADEDIQINDIENAAGISRNRLYSGFKQFLGEPPTTYLKRIRLEGARREILQDNANSNITTVALNWKFNHLGRFSSDYKKQFSETPSETLSRIRS